jgi:hypothetical protein
MKTTLLSYTLLRSKWFHLLLLTIVAMGGIPLANRPAVAQTFGGIGAHFQNDPNWISLPEFLPRMVWNSEEQGLFLAVGADQIRLPRHLVERMGTKGELKEGETPPPFRLSELESNLSLNALMVRRVGRVTTLVPKHMLVLNSKPGKPDPYAGLSANDRLRLLLPLLEPAQLRKLFGTTGLGINDLNPKQRPLFESILPASGSRITKNVDIYDEDGNWDRKSEETVLTSEQVAAIRLRFAPRLNWWFTAQNGAAQYNLAAWESQSAPGTTHTRYDWSGAGVMPSNSTSESTNVFGVSLRQIVPERLKPGQLPWDWEVLNRTISLEGAQTLGDIIERVRKTTGAQIFADRRYAVRAVAFRGTQANVRDLLKALCHSVNGAFRRVGDIFVLTDDIEGLGTRHTRIWRWYEEAVREANAIDAAAEAAIGKQDLAQYLDWSGSNPATDPYAPDDKLRQAMLAHRERNRKWKSGEGTPPEEAKTNPRQYTFWAKVNELPPAMRSLVQSQIEKRQETIQQAGISTDRINVTVQTNLVMVVPGVGEVPAAGFYSPIDRVSYMLGEPEFPPSATSATTPEPVTANRNVPRRVLIVAPKTDEEARTLVRHATAKGFTALWVEVPADGEAIVKAALQTGKEAGIDIGVVVQVLRQKGANPQTVERNILGETPSEFARFALRSLPGGQHDHRFHHHYLDKWFSDPLRTRRSGDWQSIKSSETRKQTLESVLKIASLPGLTALVLRDYAPDGYRDFVDIFASQETIGLWRPGDDYGYTVAMRREFIQRYGADPIDLSPLYESRLDSVTGSYRSQETGLSLPLLPDWGPPNPRNPVEAQGAGMPQSDLLKVSVELHRAWNEFRRETAQALVKELVDSIRQTHTELPLYGVRAGSVVWLNEPFRSIPLTEGAKATELLLPKPTISAEGRINEGQSLQTSGKLPGFRVWILPPMETREGTTRTFRIWVGAYFSRSKDVLENGLTIDLTAFPVAEVTELLEKSLTLSTEPKAETVR